MTPISHPTWACYYKIKHFRTGKERRTRTWTQIHLPWHDGEGTWRSGSYVLWANFTRMGFFFFWFLVEIKACFNFYCSEWWNKNLKQKNSLKQFKNYQKKNSFMSRTINLQPWGWWGHVRECHCQSSCNILKLDDLFLPAYFFFIISRLAEKHNALCLISANDPWNGTGIL